MKSRLVLGLLLFGWCGIVASSFAQTETNTSLCSPANRWAILIVTGSSVTDTAASKETVAAALQRGLIQAGFPQEQIIVLAPDQPNSNQKPTPANIRAQLQWIVKADVEGPIPNQPPLRSLNEACEVFVYVQMLGIKSAGGEQYLCPLTEEGATPDFENAAQLLPVMEISEALARSAVERRFLIMNILSPIVTRSQFGSSSLGGVDTNGLQDRTPEIETASRVGFGQVIVNGQIGAQPGTVDSLTNIFLQGLSGFADQALQGNRDNRVTLREMSDYLEHYGNMAAAGSVKTLFQGHDYTFTAIVGAAKSVPTADTVTILERVGKGMLEKQASANDAATASESFQRAFDLARKQRNPAAMSQVIQTLFSLNYRRDTIRMVNDADCHIRLVLGNNATFTDSSGTQQTLNAGTVLILRGSDNNRFQVETPDSTLSGWLPVDARYTITVQENGTE